MFAFPPLRMIRRLLPTISFVVLSLLPVSALALPGQGPRVDIEGQILQVNLTKDHIFNKKGGEVVVKISNGQTIQVILMNNAKIITEGRLSRKSAIPADLRAGMNVRARGLRLTVDSINANMIVITNLEKNPGTSANGIIQAIGDTSISILNPAGVTQTFSINSDTEVNVEYKDKGRNGLNFVGKQAFLSFSRGNPQLVKIVRVALPNKN